MCLFSQKRSNNVKKLLHSKFDIAPCDILVYKVLRYDKWQKQYTSPYRAEKYVKGLKSQEIKKRSASYKNADRIRVDIGLHSCVTLVKAKNVEHSCDLTNSIIVEMIIPKGAKYVVGNNDDIVSNQLLWTTNKSKLSRAKRLEFLIQKGIICV